MSSHDVRDTLRFLQNTNVRLQEENQQLRKEVAAMRRVLDALRALQEVSADVNEHTNILKLMDRILETALASIDAHDGSLLLVDEDTDELAFVVVHGEVRDTLVGHRIPPGAGIAGWVAQNGEMVIVPDVSLDPRFSPNVDQEFNFHTRSMLCVPIIYRNRVAGVIQALNKEDGQQFTKEDLTLLGVVAQLAAAAMRKAETAVPANA